MPCAHAAPAPGRSSRATLSPSRRTARRALLALALLLAWGALSASTVCAQTRPAPPSGVARIWGSAADNDRPTALHLNPAGLAFQPSWGVHYLHTDVGLPLEIGRGEGDALFVAFKPFSFWGLGLGTQVLYPTPTPAGTPSLGTHVRVTAGTAFRAGKWFALGLNFHGFFGDNSAIQSLTLWDAGLMLRPWNALSLGVMARNLNAPTYGDTNTIIPRTWELALSLRPLLTDRWVISADVRIPETGQGVTFAYRMQGEPVSGWLIGARVTHDLPVSSVGFELFLGFRFGHFGLQTLGAAGLTTQPQTAGNFAGWTAALWYSGAPYSSLARPRHRMPLLDIAGSLPERSHGFPFGGSKPRFLRLILAIERARRDTTVSGLLVRIGSLHAGLAKIQEVRQALLRFKKAGKTIVVYLAGAQMKAYYLASVADKIFLNPAGSVWMSGLSTRHLFFADALKKLGIQPQFVKFGKYKTGPNQFTRSSMTPAHKEASQTLLDDLYKQVLAGVAAGRKVPTSKVKAWLKQGLYAAAQAKQSGVVDDTFYWDEMWEKLAKLTNGRMRVDAGYFQRRKAPSRWRGLRDAIAVIHVDGPIVSGNNVDDPLFGVHLSGASTLIRYLIKARYDARIKAVVLRINSPGGEVLASDLLWRYVSLLRKTKPVVVSMGSVAASGGYYIAAPAHKIVASPATVTGSIGIYAGKFDFSGLLKKIGVTVQSQKRGAMAGLFSPYSSWTAEQRQRFQAHIKRSYQQFLQKVAAGRKMKVPAVQKVAAGRVWSGQRAQSLGLVDRLGGLWTALQTARELASIPPQARVRTLSWPDRSHWRLAPLRALGLSSQHDANAGPLQRLIQRLRSQLQGSSAPSLLPSLLGYWRNVLARLTTPQMWAISPHLLHPKTTP